MAEFLSREVSHASLRLAAADRGRLACRRLQSVLVHVHTQCRAHVGYLPTDKVVGISKLARVVDAYARRFQVQEKLTAQIAHCIGLVLKPRGVGVVIDAVHQCMTTRGVHKRGVSMVTSQMLGTFREDARTRAEFLRFIDIDNGR